MPGAGGAGCCAPAHAQLGNPAARLTAARAPLPKQPEVGLPKRSLGHWALVEHDFLMQDMFSDIRSEGITSQILNRKYWVVMVSVQFSI